MKNKYYIKFEQDGFVDGKLEFNKGKVYAFDNQASAIRWVNRGHTEVSESDYKNQGKKVDIPPAPPVPPTPPSPPVNPPSKDDKTKDAGDEDGL